MIGTVVVIGIIVVVGVLLSAVSRPATAPTAGDDSGWLMGAILGLATVVGVAWLLSQVPQWRQDRQNGKGPFAPAEVIAQKAAAEAAARAAAQALHDATLPTWETWEEATFQASWGASPAPTAVAYILRDSTTGGFLLMGELKMRDGVETTLPTGVPPTTSTTNSYVATSCGYVWRHNHRGGGGTIDFERDLNEGSARGEFWTNPGQNADPADYKSAKKLGYCELTRIGYTKHIPAALAQAFRVRYPGIERRLGIQLE